MLALAKFLHFKVVKNAQKFQNRWTYNIRGNIATCVGHRPNVLIKVTEVLAISLNDDRAS